tara:strand:+ start:443 stop:685 length:243 start_codon:yes stop_codon:yes gene_type:complete
MSTTKITLSVPNEMLKKLKEEKEKYCYISIQELIVSVLRNKYYLSPSGSSSKKGRPRKMREGQILSRKKIFSKKGDAISI